MNICTIEALNAEQLAERLYELAEVLQASVAAGASIGFVEPFSLEDAANWWRGQLGALQSGAKLQWVALQDGRVIGTAQLQLDMPANGRHRGEVCKVMVHPAARRQGAARLLMQAVEAGARAKARSLLVLDTNTGSPAERLYASLGYITVGSIPAYASQQDGSLGPTTVMYRELS
ncbi:GNAT family N-acetyltransferase [Chitinimonas sp.]|uniref:GNAT family N-acetyltransferase n=1 Tax=Chitinimonas sp. TaxID=1934313 RepID=UPI002F927A1B